MLRAMLVLALVGCARQAPVITPWVPPVLATYSPPAACVEGDARALAWLRDNAKSNPMQVLVALGVGIDDFEPLAKILYAKWRETHPEPQVPVVHSLPSAPIAVRAPPPSDSPSDEGWWCFHDNDWTSGFCEDGRRNCQELLARVVHVETDRCKYPVIGVSADSCIDDEIRIAAEVRGYALCARQWNASCFHARSLMTEREMDVCAPTIKLCISRRTEMTRDMKDDVSVLSDCRTQ